MIHIPGLDTSVSRRIKFSRKVRGQYKGCEMGFFGWHPDKGVCMVVLVVSKRFPVSLDHAAGNVGLVSVMESSAKGNMNTNGCTYLSLLEYSKIGGGGIGREWSSRFIVKLRGAGGSCGALKRKEWTL